jgi:hypothetical protein
MDELRDNIARIVGNAMWNREKVTATDVAESILGLPEIARAMALLAIYSPNPYTPAGLQDCPSPKPEA